MISHISIKDFATIENIDVDLNSGLNIITGETGAGKSVFLTAISLALGKRADNTMIRTGCAKATVQVVFDMGEEDIIISREIASSGKNLCKINGEIVPLSKLAETCASLADIHGQYDNQFLLKHENQIKLIDEYNKTEIYPIAQQLALAYSKYSDLVSRIKKAEEAIATNQQFRDLLAFQVQEIQDANLKLGEDDELKEEIEFLKNKEKIYNGLWSAYSLATSDSSDVLGPLSTIMTKLQSISAMSKDAANLEEQFSDIYYRLEDLVSQLRDAADKINMGADNLDALIERYDLIDDLKRKYGNTIEIILMEKESKEQELNKINNWDSYLQGLYVDKDNAEGELRDLTKQLTRLRRVSADTLQFAIQNELNRLNFAHAELNIAIESTERFGPNGMDDVEFLITTNRGEALKPLARVASGGELSRIMLAFKKVLAEYDSIPTMIFDEIDSGISGETANIVGKVLGELGNTHQVIVITHLPQIAARGNYNYRIEKSSDLMTTHTSIVPLNEEQKIAEVARLLAGDNVSETALNTARELINS